MPDYSKGVIYTVRSRSREDLVYVGSTTQTLAKRLGGHRSDFRGWKKTGKGGHVSSFDILEIGDEYIELLIECPCENVQQLRRHEGELIRSMECVNKCVAGRTLAEWCEDNREQMREYRTANREQIAEQQRGYRTANREQIAEQQRGYKEANREYIAEQQRMYREYQADNSEQIAAWKRERIVCECGTSIQQCSKARHQRTKKHREWQDLYDFITS
jgi:hypothetical protein